MSSNPREPNTDGYGAYDSFAKAESYVNEILEDEARIQARESVSPKRKRRGVLSLAVSLPVLLGLSTFNWFDARRPPAPLPDHVAMREAQVGIYLAIQQIEAYKDVNRGQLPATLEEAGADAPGLSFDRVSQGYRLTADVQGMTESYLSGEDASRFEQAAAAVMTPQKASR